MLHSHDMYYEKDLSFLLNFLGDEEIDILVTKLTVRMNLFKSGGILSFDSNVFGTSPEADGDFGKKDVQKFEDPNESDEEIETLFEKSERGRCLEGEEQIPEIEDNFQGDSDDDVTEDQKNDDDNQTELAGNDHLHNEEEQIIGRTVTEFEDEQKRKIENMLFSDEECDGNSEEEELEKESETFVTEEEQLVEDKSDNENVSTKLELEPSVAVDKVEEFMEEDPLRNQSDSINLKAEMDATVKLEGTILLLDSEDKDEEQTAGSKKEISTEVDQIEDIRSGKYDHMNLVLSFKSRNFCRLCYDACGNPENLRKHEELKHSDEKETLERTFFSVRDLRYRCDYCPQIPGFLTENLVLYHMRKDHKGKKFPQKVTCHLCQKQFQSRSIRNHLETHNTELNHECNLCYKKFKVTKNLKIHQKKYHGEQRKYFGKIIPPSLLSHGCSKCDLRFVSEAVLQYHVRVDHSHSNLKTIDTYQCKLCYRELKTRSNHKTHMKVHKEDLEALDRDISEDELEHSCYTCDLKFISKHILIYHSLFKHSARKVSNKRYQCTLCYENFTLQDNVSRHCKNVHPEDLHLLSSKIEGKLDLQCEHCSKTFLSANILQLHVTKKHGGSASIKELHTKRKSTPNVYCKLCYVNFNNNANLRRHVETVHKNDQQFLERDLTENDLKFPCVKCDKKFVSEAILRNHLAFHKQVEFAEIRKKSLVNKSFNCSLCHSEYKDFRTLAKHIEKIHEEDRDLMERDIDESELVFQCDECSLKFLKESFLSYHKERKHNHQAEFNRKYYRKCYKNKRYTCNLCYCNYKDTSALIKHFSKIHAGEEALLEAEISEEDRGYSCKICPLKFIQESHLNYHSERKHPGGKLKFKVKISGRNCKLCFVKFKQQRIFRFHVIKVHAKEMEAFDKELEESDLSHGCGICEKRFYSINSLHYHETRVHRKKHHKKGAVTSNRREPLVCSLCYKTFKFGPNLKRHQAAVHKADQDLLERKIEPEELQYKCTVCEKSFVRVHILKYHMRSQHADQSDGYCKLCQIIVMKGNAGLQNHKKRVHADVTDWDAVLSSDNFQFSCDCCEKTFLTECSAVFHRFIQHSGLGRTSCDLCLTDFKNNLNLKRHKENIHTSLIEMRAFGIKQKEDDLSHVCNSCGKKFLTENILNYHVNYTHKMEKRREDLQCVVCKVSWPWTSNRQRLVRTHMRELHGVSEKKAEVSAKNETLENFLNILKSL